jgi:hypothetical protein
MTLATHGADGPWAAAVFYARDGDDLIFLSSPASRHARHLALDARCAATIQPEVADWRSIRGIQLEGGVAEIDGDERARAQHCYWEKFPFAHPAKAVVAIQQALARVRWYRLRVARLVFVDNGRGFGQREVFEA